ncbi:MAG: BrnA antitoxin family protein [Alphaproteobacteria bacterium]|nr:BrnA antitoxin family protein [Alphaproteobacteria bacterium]
MTGKNKKNSNSDDEAPELTKELAAELRSAREMLPPDVYAALAARKPGQRGKQKKPTKKPVYLRLDPEVLAHFKSTGAGWQSRINDFLKAAVANVVA